MFMVKHVVALLVVSIIALLLMPQLSQVLGGLSSFHQVFLQKLGLIFAGDSWGGLLRHIFALVLIPLVIGGIPALVYWLIKHDEMPYLATVLWLLWGVLITITALHR